VNRRIVADFYPTFIGGKINGITMRTSNLLLFGIAFFLSTSVFGQARIVLNDAVFMPMDGGVFLVVDNPNANAITRVGTADGVIISEDEDNKVKWNIGTATGTYVLPFGAASGLSFEEIPLTVDVTGAGTGAGNLQMSVFGCPGGASASNTPWPSNVTHLNDALTGTTNNNTYVIDRWWVIDANGYIVKPSVDMTLTYVRHADEIGGSNLLIEANLRAQRFNDAAGLWEVTPTMTGELFGTVTIGATSGIVSNIVAGGINFHSSWTLTGVANALPIELLYFTAACEYGGVAVQWSTASETNNSYFAIQRSADSQTWETLTTINGAGNSSGQLTYGWMDENPLGGAAYYRIKQTDFDGNTETFQAVSGSGCDGNDFDVVVFNNGADNVSVGVTSSVDDQLVVSLIDMRGRVVSQEVVQVTKGFNTFNVKRNGIAMGWYNLSLRGEQNLNSQKVLLK
jgi:hypothetical protein